MGRQPGNGVPAFRFTSQEVVEMERVLHENSLSVPSREILTALAERFSNAADREGKVPVQGKQVWNWFQNRRHALKTKSVKPVENLQETVAAGDDPIRVNSKPQPTPPVPPGRHVTDNQSVMEFEAKSARDSAWYDVSSFLSHRYFDTGDPEVLVRFAGFGEEEDEWVNVKRRVRQRSLPCESSECISILPTDPILCFQEGKEQALYFDAKVLDAQRRRHDARGCRCRFLVVYEHDQSEEIVPLRKLCRRPETDHRLQQLHEQKASQPATA